MDIFLQIVFSSLETGSVYALAALGIIIIFKTSNMVNYAQGSLGMVNAFSATFFLMSTGIHPIISALAGMCSAIVLGIVIDFVVMRHAKKISPLSKQIITFGMIMLLLGLAPMVFGTSPLSFPKFMPEGQITLAGAHVTFNALFNIILGVSLMFALFMFLQKTKWGLAIRVTASNENTAQLMGVPTGIVTMGSWAFAASLGTLAALMLAPAITVNVSMMDSVQVSALVACVLGGFQTFYGPVLGAYIVALSRNLLIYYVDSTWGEVLLYSLILLFIVFRPNGIIGKKIVKKV